jgi:asparagine synthase (glutamine-hydrolysing)
MCGINGVLAFDGLFKVTPDYVERARDTMAHRGPDGVGSWISDDARVGLGFRRLAIIDLSPAAMQPMSNEDGSLRLVFNGEIYNHAEIRAELEALGGHTWATDHADTEVILHAYEQWGPACLHRLRGMFAFGLWDGRDRSLWLVRDRIGIKPLYWTIHDRRLVFASEIKALLTDPDQRRTVDEDAFFHYLSFLTTPAPDTLVQGIHKLAGGTWLRVSYDGSVVERRWWDVWDHVTPLVGVSEADIAERLLAELRTSVRLRKVSDVPVGVFLSGGLDSSTNAALFSEGESRPVKTFSIGYEGDYTSYRNELHWARRMAAEVGAEHHELLLSQDDLLEFQPRMVRLQDEPIADPVCVPVYYVSKLARDHGVKVAQVGEGADELFCGYPSWRRALGLQRADRWPVPRRLKSAGLIGLRAFRRDSHMPYEWLRRGVAGQPVFWGGAEAFTQREKERLLSLRLREQFRGRSSWEALEPIRKRFEASAWERSDLHWMTYLDLSLRLPELLLMRVDKMSMGASLEGRVPFLDHEFVAFALSIPTAAKTRDGTLKHILKRAVRGVIPDDYIDRQKQGFGVPITEWYRDRLGDRVRSEVDTFIRDADLLDAAQVRLHLASGDGAWYLHNAATWWASYVRGPHVAA